MRRHFFRFFSKSLLAFETRLEHQSDQRTAVKLHLEPAGMDCCIYDSVIPMQNGPALFRGLGIDVYCLSEDGNPAQVRPFCERLLGLLSYSNMSPCHPTRLEMTYDAEPGRQDREFTFIRTASVPETAPLRKIDLELFHSVTEKQHFDDDSKWLALEWFRKALTEEYTLDEFVAYWSALELLAGALKRIFLTAPEQSYSYCPTCKVRISNCPHCGGDVGTQSPWAGLFYLIDQGIGVGRKEFSAVRKFRGGVLHGGTNLSNQAVEQMKSRELIALRRLVIFALSTVFKLPTDIAERIASQKLHRVVTPVTTKLFGSLNLNVGEPPPIEKIDLQPFLRADGAPDTYELGRDGKLAISTGVTFRPISANYKINRTELWADQGAGPTDGTISLTPGRAG